MSWSTQISLGYLIGVVVVQALVGCSGDDDGGDAADASGKGGAISSGGSSGNDAETPFGGASSSGGKTSGGATNTGGSGGTVPDASADTGGSSATSGGTSGSGGDTTTGGSSNGTEDGAASGGSGTGGAVADGGTGTGGLGTGGAVSVISALEKCAKPGDAGAPLDDSTDGGAAPCTVLAFDAAPFGLVLDGSHVYWTSFVSSGRVARVSTHGGAVETIAAGEPKPSYLAVAGGNAVWATDGTSGKVVTIPLSGGERKELGTAFVTGILGVATDGTNAYYATNYNVIRSVPLAGGPMKTPAQGPYNTNLVDLLLRGDQLYWTNDGKWNNDYTAKDPKSAAVYKVHVSGTPASSAVVKGLDFPQFFLFVDDAYVFWNSDKFIYRATLLGENVTELAPLASSPPSSPIVDLVSDGTDLYFATRTTLSRVPVAGGPVTTVSAGWRGLHALAIDADSVFLADLVDGAVVKLEKNP